MNLNPKKSPVYLLICHYKPTYKSQRNKTLITLRLCLIKHTQRNVKQSHDIHFLKTFK